MKTTNAHFELFKSECKKWIKIWGLLDWDVTYKHENLENNRIAQTISHYGGKVAVLSLGMDYYNRPTTTYEIKKSAFHEVAELLLSELNCIANARYITEDEVENARHTVIRRLENVVFRGGGK